MIKKEQIKEYEEQRLGRNKDTKVNLTYINSGKYRKKFNYPKLFTEQYLN